MPDRPRVFLPWGEGLERRRGVMAIEPPAMADLRNVFLYDGKAQARKGITATATLVDEVAGTLQAVLALSPLRSEQASLGLGYNTTNKRVHANRMTVGGTGPVHVASGSANKEVWTIPGIATFDPPIVHLADTHNKVFMAHDEPNISARQVTRYYDPFASPTIQTLQADLDGNGDADVKFRGVIRWLSYLVGWGYRDATTPDRPDYVRVSLSGDPLLWREKHFFLAGQRAEPVLSCHPAGNVLLVFKETETYQIFGYSPQTFGIRPIDSLYGLAGARLAVSVAGTVFFWSHEGPRMSDGGVSADLAPPLDIGGPDPATLVAEGNPEDAFAQYFPQDRVVVFVWGRRVYALSIRDPSRPRWSYWEIGATAEPRSGAVFFSTLATGGGGTAPTGWPVIQDFASGVLTLTGQPADTEIVTIDTKVYTFQTVLTNVDGNVLIGATASDSLDNLIAAITLGAGAGTTYAAATTLHPTVTAAAGPGDTMDATAKLPGGNSIVTTTNLANGSWGGATLSGGQDLNDLSIGFTVFNNGGGGANGTEVIEPWVKDIDGANVWVKQGDVVINLSGGGPNFSQTFSITGLKPLHEHDVSLRYRAAGAFTTGFTDADPALWNDPACPACPDDPPAFRQALFTTATAPILTTRAGDNNGLWERTAVGAENIVVPIEIPAGHEDLVMEVSRQRETDGDLAIQNINGLGPPDDSLDIVEAFTIVEAALAAASTSYEDLAITGEQLHTYRLKFLSPGNAPNSGDSNLLGCWAGPDPPTGFMASDAGVFTVQSNWTNSVTPSEARVCPPQPPSAHSTDTFFKNVTQGGVWILEGTAVPFSSSALIVIAGGNASDTVRVAIRHLTTCNGVIDYSRWALPGFKTVVITGL